MYIYRGNKYQPDNLSKAKKTQILLDLTENKIKGKKFSKSSMRCPTISYANTIFDVC